MNIKELLNEGVIELRKHNVEETKLKSRILLSHILGKQKEYLITHDDEEISMEKEREFFSSIHKLKQGIPIQYITNHQEFMKLDFYVDENVLIPQGDTEVLVEEVIEISKRFHNENSSNQNINQDDKASKEVEVQILDLCTGSGAIGVCLAKYIDKAKVYCSDISFKALQIAKLNSEKNFVHTKMEFIESDLFEKIKDITFDIIVSNPPYIQTNIIHTLDKEVRNEPMIALNGGQDGLDFYHRIVEQAYLYLNNDGYLCLEIGYDQKMKVIEIIKQTNKYKHIYCIKDLAGNDRVIVAKRVN